jgi:hypothetical protein
LLKSEEETDDKHSIEQTISVVNVCLEKGLECLEKIFAEYYIAINHQITCILKEKECINLTQMT